LLKSGGSARRFAAAKSFSRQASRELPDMVRASELEKIATFNDFNQENGPQQERGYGSFRPLRPEFCFKIDYFYLELEMASPDPAEPAITKRIMAMGLAQDW
jgi:hypothetical protein